MRNVCQLCGSENEPGRAACAVCGAATVAGAKEGAVTAATGSRFTVRRAALVLFPVLAVGGLWLLWSYLHRSEHPVLQGQPVVGEPRVYDSTGVKPAVIAASLIGDDIAIPLDAVTRNSIVRFEYTGGATPRWLLAYVATNGKLVTAISLSEHCGSTEFLLRGDQIVCAHCPSRWHMTSFEAYACCGKYYPDPIPSRVEGPNVLIARADVDRWAGRM
ncbi:MAG: hypothetical protein H6Q29_1352 [Bacteroidetes bacterium]|nr:hypothetical protein [Bacteroidota bacterium]